MCGEWREAAEVNMSDKQLSLDCDNDGLILPTLRNKKTVNDLFKKHQSIEKVQEIMGNDYSKFVAACMFDPRNKNVFFESAENARKAKDRANLINQLDREWLNKE